MAKHKRGQIFVDSQVQGVLLSRAVLYWAFCLISITFMLLCWRIVSEPRQTFLSHFGAMWQQYAPALVASILLLPMVVVDSVRVSNRFAGPMIRIRRELKNLAAGEKGHPVNFREADFWSELGTDYNRVLERLEAAEANSRAEPPAAEEA